MAEMRDIESAEWMAPPRADQWETMSGDTMAFQRAGTTVVMKGLKKAPHSADLMVDN